MTRIYTTATIACPIEDLYDYVTTPAHWPEWHPSSLGVSDGADHSLTVGEEVTERFLVAGRRGSVVWRVTERDAPNSWVIVGAIESSKGGGNSGPRTTSVPPEASAMPTCSIETSKLAEANWTTRSLETSP